MTEKRFKLAELAKLIEAKLNGNGEQIITGIAPLQTATASQISFFHNSRYRQYLSSTKAAAVIISATDLEACELNTDALVVSNPYLAFAKGAELFAYRPENPLVFILPLSLERDARSIQQQVLVLTVLLVIMSLFKRNCN